MTRNLEAKEKKKALQIGHEGGRGRGRVVPRGRGRGRRRAAYNKATVECYKCHNLGHYPSECLEWNKETNYAEINEEEILLMSYAETRK